jgi:hypothetical protein
MGRKYFNIIIFCILCILPASCQKEVYNTYPTESTQTNGKIFIQSKPSNATIYLNSKNMGLRTPDTLKWLSNGEQLLTLRLPLYSDTTFKIQSFNGQINNIFIDFSLNSKNYGKIFVESQPDNANIWLNDSLTSNKSPSILTYLIPGNYKIKCTYPLSRPDSTNVTVASSTTVQTYLTLEDTSQWVSYNTKNTPSVSNYIFTLACDSLNVIWIGTDRGVLSVSGKKWNVYNKNNSILKSNNINCIAVDYLNRKWIGTATGLFMFDGTNWTDYSGNLPDHQVTKIIFDKMNNVWIGTYGGLVQFSNGIWSTFITSNSGLKENMVMSLAVDNINRIWVGSVYNYISIYDGNSWKYYNDTNIHKTIKGTGLDAYITQSMVCDNLGRMWVVFLSQSLGGAKVVYFDGSDWSIFDDILFHFDYPLTIISKNKYLIFGNNLSVGILETGADKLTSYKKANSALQIVKVQAVAMDKQNNVWIGTMYCGMGKFKNGNF